MLLTYITEFLVSTDESYIKKYINRYKRVGKFCSASSCQIIVDDNDDAFLFGTILYNISQLDHEKSVKNMLIVRNYDSCWYNSLIRETVLMCKQGSKNISTHNNLCKIILIY